jgi:hypothetical protein
VNGSNRQTEPSSLPRRNEADDATSSRRREFSPSGQLVLPGAPAQLGLDGAAYAPLPSGEAASHYLGTHTVVSPDAPDPASQLELPGLARALDDSPQLNLWARLERSRSLLGGHVSGQRSRDGGAFDRQAKCLWVRYTSETSVEVTRDPDGSYTTSGLVRCGSWLCPACGPAHAREAVAALAISIDRHLASSQWTDVWMLTLTANHAKGDNLEELTDRLYRAAAALWEDEDWERFATRWGVVARVRVLDVTFGGANGTHPHFHIALFVDTDGAIVPDELDPEKPLVPIRKLQQSARKELLKQYRGALVLAWERACLSVGFRAPSRRHGLHLQPGELAASYLVAWGLADELAAGEKPRNHLRLLDAYAAGFYQAGELYKSWRRATDRRQWVTGLGRLRRHFGVTDDDVTAYHADRRARREAELSHTPIVRLRPVRVVVAPHLYAVVTSLGWPTVHAAIDELARFHDDDAGVQAGLNAYLWRRLYWRRRLELSELGRAPPAPS